MRKHTAKTAFQVLKKLANRAQMVRAKIKENPMNIYRTEGKKLILILKEIHIIGSILLKESRKNVEKIKKIPVEL